MNMSAVNQPDPLNDCLEQTLESEIGLTEEGSIKQVTKGVSIGPKPEAGILPYRYF